MLQVDGRAVADARAYQARKLHREHHEHAERCAYRQDHECEIGVMAVGRDVESEQRDDDDDVVEDWSEGRPEELALRVEQPGDDRSGSVEHDLDGEEAEEVRGKPGLIGRDSEGLRSDDLLGEDGSKERDDAERDDGQVEDRACVAPGVLITALLATFQEDGDEERGDDSAGHEFVDHVGDVVRNAVRGRSRCHA